MKISMIDNALKYANAGYKVFPCLGKRPLTAKGFKDASKDIEQIKSWWTQHPDANIGLVTGKENNLLVIDIDVKGNGYQSLNDLENIVGQLRGGIEVITGSGGLHIYLKYPENTLVKCSTRVLPGIDIRGEGGYVIAPPSLHESMRRYKWNS